MKYKIYLLICFCIFINVSFGQNDPILLGENGLTATGTSTTRKVLLGGTLTQNTSFDLGATFTYNIKKGTTNYLHILNNGNIGLGTNAPTAALDVIGASRFRNTLTVSYGTLNRTTRLTDVGLFISRTSDGSYPNSITGDGEMILSTRGNFRFKNNSINRFIIKEDGSIGIGTITPLAQLHSTGSVLFAGLLNDNAAPRVISSDINGNLSWRDVSTLSGGAGSWAINGTNLVNTNTGFVSIGTSANPAPTDPQLKLAVNGNIYAQKLKITQQGWADYVFETNYKLMPLSELEAYINKNKHLPDVPSALEVEKKGLDIGDNQTILLKKIEELTLYVIELKKEIDTLKLEQTNKTNKK